MVCKKCGFEIKENWKYCPKCSKKIYKKQDIICIVIIIIAICLLIPAIKNNMPVNEKFIENYLEKKYNENFSDVSFIKSEKNQDTDLSCDGSNFGKIKVNGSKKYYKVYSNKNNMEFIAIYDTSDESKNINDNYLDNLRRRRTIVEAYSIIYDYLYNNNYKITLVRNSEKISIDSENQLEDILSKYNEANLDFDNVKIYIDIDADLSDFCKSNYKTIINLNNKLVELQKSNKYYFSTTIWLDSDASIELYRLDDKPYIYDKYGGTSAWGETLDEFITRESN